jgi:glucose-6-phosphate isomerase
MKLDFTYAWSAINQNDFEDYLISATKAAKMLVDKQGKGSEFTGWLDLPNKTRADFIAKVERTSKCFSQLDVVVIIGIGGSYLGAKAVIEALNPLFGNESPEIVFAGHHLSSRYYDELLDYLNDKSFGIVVISKSGTTTEPAIAFRLLYQLLIQNLSEVEASKRIVAITDEKKGALKAFADAHHIETFIIPDDVGGRFSVLTPVGLLPIAIAGIDINELIKGAFAAMTSYANTNEGNIAIKYAAVRNYFYKSGKNIELLTSFDPDLKYIAEWWKQLFGESEGKQGKGIFPASAIFTTDLHSLGQYIQDGERTIFETLIAVKNVNCSTKIPSSSDNLDQLNYLSGKPLSWINTMAEQGTCEAHEAGGVPVIKIEMKKLDAFNIGKLIYFFEFACGVSAYMLKVNPFDQPGVEAYKNNMFRLLGK